jgi:hypothetical protein
MTDWYHLQVRVVSGVLISMVVGAAYGATTSFVNNVPGLLGEVGQSHNEDSPVTWAAIFISLILDSGWAWAALAFFLGWLWGSQARLLAAATVGAIVGAAGLVAATVTYYSADMLFGIGAYWQMVSYWLIRAVAFGLLLGIAGAMARRPQMLGLFAALTVPTGMAMNMVLFPLESGLPGESSAAKWAQCTVWVLVVAGAAFVTLRFARFQQPRRSAMVSGVAESAVSTPR